MTVGEVHFSHSETKIWMNTNTIKDRGHRWRVHPKKMAEEGLVFSGVIDSPDSNCLDMQGSLLSSIFPQGGWTQIHDLPP